MSAFLKTKQAQRLAQTALHQDAASYQGAGSAYKTTAATLAPVLNTINQGTPRLYGMAGASMSRSNGVLKITEHHSNLSRNIKSIEDTADNMAIANEATVSVSANSGCGLDAVQEPLQSQDSIASDTECVSSLMRGLGLSEPSVNSMAQDAVEFDEFTSESNKLTTEAQGERA